MAITIAPILKTITSFDSTEQKEINFTLERMNIVPASVNVTIKNNATNEIVFTDSAAIGVGVTTYTIPANSLTNNVYYKCSITISDITGEISPESNEVSFYCITNPVFEFTNVPFLINTSSLSVQMNYREISDIYNPLVSFYVILLNSNNQERYNSGTIYVSDNTSLNVEIYNMEEDTYTLKAVGETLYGLTVETEQALNVQFSRPSSFSALILDNMFDRGNIRITSNVKGLMGVMIGEEKYIDNEKIDLTEKGSGVLFDKGFNIKDNFYIKLWMEHIIPNTNEPFLEIFQDDGITIKAFWRKSLFKVNNNEPKVYIELIQYNKYFNYVIKSNFITPPSLTEQVFIGIKKINSYIQMKIENKGDV